MSVKKIDIINASLLLVGAKKLTSLSAATKGARLASAMYEMARNEIFALPIDWKFATVRAQLSAYGTDPAFGTYDYQFELPSGCCRVIALIDDDGDETEYEWRRELYVETSGDNEFEHDMLLTDQSSAYIKYIRIRENISKWPAYFSRLVILNLAVYLCEPLKQDKQKKNQLLVMYENARKEAEQSNSLSDMDVSTGNVNLDRGNTDVVDAASDEKVTKRYITRET